MNGWRKSLPGGEESGIRFVGDPNGEFAKAWDTQFDTSGILGGVNRSKRYAAVVEDGKVTRVEVEPDNFGTKVSRADQIL